jgi:hypothetical protein
MPDHVGEASCAVHMPQSAPVWPIPDRSNGSRSDTVFLSSPSEFRKFTIDYVGKWGKAIRAANSKIDWVRIGKVGVALEWQLWPLQSKGAAAAGTVPPQSQLGVDYVFNVPLDTAAAITGYRHNRAMADDFLGNLRTLSPINGNVLTKLSQPAKWWQ